MNRWPFPLLSRMRGSRGFQAVLNPDGTVSFSGSLTAANGEILSGQTETVTVGGTSISVPVTTASDSSFSGTFVAPTTPGVYTVTATFAGATVGEITYSGSSATAALTVTAPTVYTVTFAETGLPSGTTWYVNVAGTVYSSATGSISFQSANGTFQFTILNVPGYTPSPTSGTLQVNDANVTTQITFATGTEGFSLVVDASAGPITVSQNEQVPWSMVGGTANGSYTVHFGAATQTGTFGDSEQASGEYTFATAGTIDVYAVDTQTGDTTNTVVVTVTPAAVTPPAITINGSASPLTVSGNGTEQLVVTSGTPGAYCSVASAGTNYFGGYFDATGTFTPAAVQLTAGSYSLVATDQSSGKSSAPFLLTVSPPVGLNLYWDTSSTGWIGNAGGAPFQGSIAVSYVADAIVVTGTFPGLPNGTTISLYENFQGIVAGNPPIATTTVSGGVFQFMLNTITNPGPNAQSATYTAVSAAAPGIPATMSNTLTLTIEAPPAPVLQVEVTVFQPTDNPGVYNGTFTLGENNYPAGTPFVAYINGQACTPAANSPTWTVPSAEGSGVFTFNTPAILSLNAGVTASFYVVAAGTQSNTVTVTTEAWTPNLVLTVSPTSVQEGSNITFTVNGAEPGDTIRFVVDLEGAYGALLTATASATGVASVTYTVPSTSVSPGIPAVGTHTVQAVDPYYPNDVASASFTVTAAGGGHLPAPAPLSLTINGSTGPVSVQGASYLQYGASGGTEGGPLDLYLYADQDLTQLVTPYGIGGFFDANGDWSYTDSKLVGAYGYPTLYAYVNDLNVNAGSNVVMVDVTSRGA